MKGPAVWPRPFVVAWVRSVRAAGSAPMWAVNMLTAEPRVRESAWALATRARVCTLAYSGMAMAARIPMMATTIISSMSVKPRWLPSAFLFVCQKLNMGSVSFESLCCSEMFEIKLTIMPFVIARSVPSADCGLCQHADAAKPGIWATVARVFAQGAPTDGRGLSGRHGGDRLTTSCAAWLTFRGRFDAGG